MRLRGIARSAFDASSRNANAAVAQKLAHVGARRLDERPHDDAGARVHAAQAARPCAAQQPQQEGFGLIVFRVRDGDRGRAEARRRTIEKRVARRVRRVFDRSARVARERRDIDALDVDRQLQPGREIAAELRVGIGIGAAQLMVQMRRAGDDETFGLGDLAQREQQRHRIGAARQRDGHTAARRKQSVICG